MARRRIRLFKYSVGQVNEELLQEYMEKHHYRRPSMIMANIIQTKILGRPITCTDDLVEAERLVNNLHYNNVGEYLEDYLRQSLFGDFKICVNCTNRLTCNKKKSDYQEACADFSNNVS